MKARDYADMLCRVGFIPTVEAVKNEFNVLADKRGRSDSSLRGLIREFLNKSNAIYTTIGSERLEQEGCVVAAALQQLGGDIMYLYRDVVKKECEKYQLLRELRLAQYSRRELIETIPDGTERRLFLLYDRYMQKELQEKLAEKL